MVYDIFKLSIIGATVLCAATPAVAQQTPMVDAATPAPTVTSAADPSLEAMDKAKARLDKETALLLSRKANSDAQASAATAEFGPLGAYTGASGNVTVDSANRSVLEATLLSALALDKAGDEIGLRLCNVVASRANLAQACSFGRTRKASTAIAAVPLAAEPVEKLSQAALCQEIRTVGSPSSVLASDHPVVIVAQTTTSVTDLADSFLLRTSALGREFCAALTAPTHAGTEEVSGGSAAGVGAVVNTIANLFRADYTLYGIALTADQSLLEKRVALAFMSSGLSNPVYLPDLSPVGPLDDSNPAVRRIAILDTLRDLASASTSVAARPRLDAAIAAYDDAVLALTTSTDGKQPLLSIILRQARTADLIRRGGYLVVTNVHIMGGTSYTKKNFFTFLGGMPYFVSGGALASYIVQDGLNGPTLDAFTIPVTSGFHRANQVDRAFPNGAVRR